MRERREREKEKQRNGATDRQSDRETERHRDRQRDKERGRKGRGQGSGEERRKTAGYRNRKKGTMGKDLKEVTKRRVRGGDAERKRERGQAVCQKPLSRESPKGRRPAKGGHKVQERTRSKPPERDQRI